MAVLALVALAAVLLRPLCGALEPIQAAAAAPPFSAQPDSHSPDESCCEAIGDGSIVASAVPAASPADFGQAAILHGGLLPPAPSTRRAASLDPPRRPPRAVPFHARTARILA